MAEYGLYGAMVRHSLPLPDAILRSRDENDEDEDDDDDSDDVISDSDIIGQTESRLNDESEESPEKRDTLQSTSPNRKPKSSRKKAKEPIAPWLLGEIEFTLLFLPLN